MSIDNGKSTDSQTTEYHHPATQLMALSQQNVFPLHEPRAYIKQHGIMAFVAYYAYHHYLLDRITNPDLRQVINDWQDESFSLLPEWAKDYFAGGSEE